MTPEEDRALAEARLEARFADLRRARTALRILQPPEEFPRRARGAAGCAERCSPAGW